MQVRREKEIELLRRQYAGVRHDPDFQWVIVEGVPVDGDFDRDETEVLFDIPPGYPQTAPDNFWVPDGLELNSGGQPDRYSSENRTHEDKKWGRFSWHEEDGWAPSDDIEDGSNLLTFMGSVQDRLAEDE